MSKRIVLFNHKGGVSKTTTTYNLGWKLAENRRVLLVDADPQCNLTSLLLCDNFDSYYLDEQTHRNNLRDGVEVAFKGKPAPIKAIDCFSPARQPNLFLIAGHPNLSEFEAALTFAQTSSNTLATLENLPGAFNEFIKQAEQKYKIDYTLLDLNPSLSSINQNLLLVSNYLIIPTNPDPFSLMAIDTLRTILPRWAAWLRQNAPLFANSSYPLPGTPPVLLGTIIQRFNIRKGKAALPYRDNIAQIKEKIVSVLLPSLRESDMAKTDEEYGSELIKNGLCLAEMPAFQGLLPKANAAGVPVYALSDDEIGETGAVLDEMKEKRKYFSGLFSEFAAIVKQLTEQEA